MSWLPLTLSNMFWVPLLLSAAGCVYLVAAAFLVQRFAKRPAFDLQQAMSVTILKPLHGDEPALFANLASFVAQDYPGPVQIVFGVQDPADPAIAVVRRLQRAFPQAWLDLVISTETHGHNRKVSNLVNMARKAGHDVIVLADSDIRVQPDYLRRIAAELQQPGVSGLTCLYTGMPESNLWARLGALSIDSHFLPSMVLGASLGLARPCLGSTIALTRASLEAIGGFAGISDSLADDYEIGDRLRALGGRVALPTFAVGHACTETSFAELWHHEIRWMRTVRGVEPAGYAGSIVTHPLPFAILAFLMGGGSLALALAALALVSRGLICLCVSNAFGVRHQRVLLVPLRDLMSFAVFVFSFFSNSVRWRGTFYRVSAGTLTQAGARRTDADIVSSSSVL